jgi:hypothetical protein
MQVASNSTTILLSPTRPMSESPAQSGLSSARSFGQLGANSGSGSHMRSSRRSDGRARRFDLRPRRLVGDTVYGAAKLLKWLVDCKITPHVPMWDRSARSDGTFSRADFMFDQRRNVRGGNDQNSRSPREKPEFDHTISSESDHFRQRWNASGALLAHAACCISLVPAAGLEPAPWATGAAAQCCSRARVFAPPSRAPLLPPGWRHR